MKKIIFFLPLLLITFVQCDNSKDFEITREDKIEKYLSNDLRDYYSTVNEAAVYGVFDSYNINEMQSKGFRRFSEITGVDGLALIDKSNEIQLKSTTSDTIVNELLNSVIKDEIFSLFSLFENLNNYYSISEEGVESFMFNEFSIYAVSHIISCENNVLNNTELSETDRIVFFSTSYLLVDILGSYEALSIFVSDNFGENLKSSQFGFLKNLWSGITKVASVIVTTVVSTVVNVVGSSIVGTGMDGVVDNAVCAIPAVFVGLYQGIVVGVECDAFDLDCLLENDGYSLACDGGI